MKNAIERDYDFKRIFNDEYFDIVSNYINLIQYVINQYDTVIFMARKAYCFYNSIKAANLIEEKADCNIFSSRVLTYSNFNLSGQKVAIIEDVVVKGIALDEVISSEIFNNVDLDIYIAACSSEFLNNFNYEENIKLCDPYKIMEENQLLEFATLITNFIVSKNIPYNIDNPIYEITCAQFNEFKNFFSNGNFCQISELLNDNKDNICKGSIHINSSVFSSILPKEILKNTVIKFRVYMNVEDKCLLVPIILFPEMSIEMLDSAVKVIFKSEVFDYISRDKDYGENLFKIFQYGLSELLIVEYLKRVNIFDESKNLLVEKQVFSFEISNLIKYDSIKIKNSGDDFSINQFELYNYLAYAYDVLFKNKSNVSDNYIDYSDIVELINNVTIEPVKNFFVYSSLILDVFIDNGIVVPRFIINQNKIIRRYKFGEVAQLTINDFLLFSNVLFDYSHSMNRALEGIEIEKISVLFFKKFHGAFDSKSNKAETFRVCYSKFGPRIASSSKAYRVFQSQALTTYLCENHLVKPVKQGSKNVYEVLSRTSDESFNVDDTKISMFVYVLVSLYKTYIKAHEMEPNNEIFDLINSYNRLLTLLAIGNDEKSKILSLVAEVHLIRAKKFDDLYHDPIQSLHKLNRIIDGVLSGIWKYFCYLNKELINRVFLLMSLYSSSRADIYLILSTLDINTDNSAKLNYNFINEIGDFLCDVALFYYYASAYYEMNIHSDFNAPLFRNVIFKKTHFTDLHNYYEAIFEKSPTEISTYVRGKFEEISIKACDIIDKYLVYESTNSFNFSNLQSCYVLFSYTKNDLKRINESKIPYIKYKNILLFPIYSSYLENIERNILMNLYTTIKNKRRRILLFESSNENVSLKCMNDKFIGEKFFITAYNAFQTYNKLEYLDYNEFTKISVNDNNSNFKIHNYNFTFKRTEKDIYEDSGLIFHRYLVNEKPNNVNNVKIDEVKNRGNIYIVNEIKNQSEGDARMEITNLTVQQGDAYIVENMTLIKNFDKKVIDDLINIKNKANNVDVEKNIDDAVNAKKEKNGDKLKNALKWIGENAMELVKTVASAATITLIESSMK